MKCLYVYTKNHISPQVIETPVTSLSEIECLLRNHFHLSRELKHYFTFLDLHDKPLDLSDLQPLLPDCCKVHITTNEENNNNIKPLYLSLDVPTLLKAIQEAFEFKLKNRNPTKKKDIISGSELATWMEKNLYVTRLEAVELGQILLENNFLFSSSSCTFLDNNDLNYRFQKSIEKKEKKENLKDKKELINEKKNKLSFEKELSPKPTSSGAFIAFRRRTKSSSPSSSFSDNNSNNLKLVNNQSHENIVNCSSPLLTDLEKHHLKNTTLNSFHIHPRAMGFLAFLDDPSKSARSEKLSNQTIRM